MAPSAPPPPPPASAPTLAPTTALTSAARSRAFRRRIAARRRRSCRRRSRRRLRISSSIGSALVERLDLLGVLLVDRLALQLHRRRQLVAARLPLLGEDRELLDLLHAGELLVRLVDGGLNFLAGLVLRGELLDRLPLEPALLRPDGGVVRVEHDQRDV